MDTGERPRLDQLLDFVGVRLIGLLSLGWELFVRMAAWVRAVQHREQIVLFPERLDQTIAGDHSVWSPFHRRVLASVILYGLITRIRASNNRHGSQTPERPCELQAQLETTFEEMTAQATKEERRETC